MNGNVKPVDFRQRFFQKALLTAIGLKFSNKESSFDKRYMLWIIKIFKFCVLFQCTIYASIRTVFKRDFWSLFNSVQLNKDCRLYYLFVEVVSIVCLFVLFCCFQGVISVVDLMTLFLKSMLTDLLAVLKSDCAFCCSVFVCFSFKS